MPIFAQLIACLLLLASHTNAATPADSRELSIAADRDLALPLREIATRYTRTHGVAINVWFADASTLHESVSEGADVDIIITANRQALTRLGRTGLIDVREQPELASIPLVLAIPRKASALEKQLSIELMGVTLPKRQALPLVYVSNPASPGYAMAKHAMHESEWLSTRPLAPLPADDAASALALMRAHTAAGLLSAHDAYAAADIKVLQVFPDNAAPATHFHAAFVAGESMKQAREFIGTLGKPAYQDIWQRYGMQGNASLPMQAH